MNTVAGKKVVLTGTFAQLARNVAAFQLKGLGATCTDTVSKNTDMVFAGTGGGSKLTKAEALGIPVLGEADLIAVLRGTPASAASAPETTGGKTTTDAKPTPKAAAAGGAAPPWVLQWFERLDRQIAELKKNKTICLLWNHRGAPVAPEQLDRIAKRAGMKLTDDMRAFYSYANGVSLVWVSKWAPEYAGERAKRGAPKLRDVEGLGGSYHVICLPALEEALERGIDHGDLEGDGIHRIGFDYPGSFVTPAFVFKPGEVADVAIGDDHGAAWDAFTTTTFRQYMETIQANWGAIHARYTKDWKEAPVALKSLLPEKPLSEDQAFFKRLRQTDRLELSAADLEQASKLAPHDSDARDALFGAFSLGHPDLSPHYFVPMFEAALAMTGPLSEPAQNAILSLLRPVPLPADIAHRVLDAEFRVWEAAAVIAAKSGAAVVPRLQELLAAYDPAQIAEHNMEGSVYYTDDSKNRFFERYYALATTAILVAEHAQILLPHFEEVVASLNVPEPDPHGVPAVMLAAAAIACIDPTRADAHRGMVGFVAQRHAVEPDHPVLLKLQERVPNVMEFEASPYS